MVTLALYRIEDHPEFAPYREAIQEMDAAIWIHKNAQKFEIKEQAFQTACRLYSRCLKCLEELCQERDERVFDEYSMDFDSVIEQEAIYLKKNIKYYTALRDKDEAARDLEERLLEMHAIEPSVAPLDHSREVDVWSVMAPSSFNDLEL